MYDLTQNKLTKKIERGVFFGLLGIFSLAILAMILAVFDPFTKEVSEAKSTFIAQLNAINPENIIGVTSDIDIEIFKDLLTNNADKKVMIDILKNLTNIHYTHEYPVSHFFVKTNIFDKKIGIEIDISAVNGEIVNTVFVGYYSKGIIGSTTMGTIIEGSSPELDKLLMSKKDFFRKRYERNMKKST